MHEASNIESVVSARLCCGCGACVVACPHDAIHIREGRHYNCAEVDATLCVSCGRCREVCPGEWTSLDGLENPEGQGADAPEHLLVCAKDESVRRDAASGGIITALLLHLLDCGAIDGAVVVQPDSARPLYCRSVLARCRDEILAARGSRYMPASACLGLREVVVNPGRYAFVGKGCDIDALRSLQAVEPRLDERIVLAIGLFCAQTPARSRTRAFLESVAINASDVGRIDYRGQGWPGRFRAANMGRAVYECAYERAWGFLAKGLPSLACLVCNDGMAGKADISVGDPWGLPPELGAGAGLSYAIVRTPAGHEAVNECVGAGAISAAEAPSQWVSSRLERQSERKARATTARNTYLALFHRVRIVQALKGRLRCLPTILRQMHRRVYY